MTDTTFPNRTPSSLPGHDLYGPIHRAMRKVFADLLVRLGRADAEDQAACLALADDLESVLCLCERHIRHEEAHIHPHVGPELDALVRSLTDDHQEHEERIVELRDLAGRLSDASASARGAVLRETYLRFSRFVAENLAHMAEEELVLQPALEAAFGAEGLAAMEGRILESMGPEEGFEVLRIMIPANPRPVQVALLTAARAGMPPPVFGALFAQVRGELDAATRVELEPTAA